MNDIINLPSAVRDGEWKPGEQAVFTYSLPFDKNSPISERLHHRSGQTVTVLNRGEDDADYEKMPLFTERAEEACLAVYGVVFSDGHEDTAFEDELSEVQS